jgi:phage terminase small subunit
VISSNKPNPKPPRHLSKSARKWFASVLESYELAPHHVRLLTLAAESWDRCVQAREGLVQNGLTFVDRLGSRRPSPEVAIERDSRIAFARLVRELGLDLGDPEAPRSPRTGGQR